MEITTVAMVPTPDQMAYPMFKGIVLSDNDKNKREQTKLKINPKVGSILENPSEAFNRDVPTNSKIMANSKNK